ncbi:glycerophosphoryl diester phosphodiesterase membrane domain-containing protein [Lacticaseibacillus brantae]|uniref:Glycerophosphoryl diester phosphodiesterase n=1 Tax=Lacticaseibacillus brantae DSM 23927 TaxID=1423727 RepID=A0A0R2AZC4_9LACO|nr:glycerophosphodiester phosphodiesterase [Lacticaseibacillus brantae]KRM72471.1 glycerophosphoryl diester phosphodiesterase [Lacticaseibacillus brantae DSM 23927]
MNKKAFILPEIRDFFKRWGSYLTLIIGINLIVSLILIPIFNWVAEKSLQLGHIGYVSYTNLGYIITHAPLVALSLVLLLLVILLTVYLQFSSLMIGIQTIRANRPFRILSIFKQAFHSLSRLTVKTALFFLGYFIVILPFGKFVFNSQLLSKAKVPEFIGEYILANPWLTALAAVLLIAIYWVAVRFLTLIPAVILGTESSNAMIGESFRASRHQFWRLTWRIFLITLISTVLTYGASGLIYLFQSYLDTHAASSALGWAVGNLSLLEIIQQIISSFNTVIVLRVALRLAEDGGLIAHEPPLVPVQPRRHKWIMRSVAVLFLLIVGISMSFYNFAYLDGLLKSNPLTISHRGVDDGNGVQNTIPALEKTSKENPDYVEMDIHETKDHQFVVMHDENLEALAGVNKRPHDLTLAQLTKLTVRENGHSAKIASFDDYLTSAERLHQKLLIEIKTTPMDSKNMLNNFIKKYQTRIIKNHDRIHSLDYRVVNGLKTKAPKLFVSYILPYNLVFPETPANAYTMEASTLNGDFISHAQDRKQAVYAWTVDDPTQMQQMMFLDVNGIITDDLGELKSTIKSMNEHPTYADQIINFTVNFQTNFESPEN